MTCKWRFHYTPAWPASGGFTTPLHDLQVEVSPHPCMTCLWTEVLLQPAWEWLSKLQGTVLLISGTVGLHVISNLWNLPWKFQPLQCPWIQRSISSIQWRHTAGVRSLLLVPVSPNCSTVLQTAGSLSLAPPWRWRLWSAAAQGLVAILFAHCSSCEVNLGCSFFLHRNKQKSRSEHLIMSSKHVLETHG